MRRLTLSRLAIERLLATLEAGNLTIVTPGGERIEHRGIRPGPTAVMTVHRWRALSRLALHGDIGLAEAYIDGDWSSPDLTAVLELGAINTKAQEGFAATSMMKRLANRIRHWTRSNTRTGAARNIVAHYDLGNEFYTRWLDGEMQYSSAIYNEPTATLEQAQSCKLDLIVERLGIAGGERVLEIGIGWGGLAERLVRRGCQVTGLTLSPSQLEFAQKRLAATPGNGRADLRLQDYRDVQGTFDRIVSIEMIEAVGESYWPSYFATIMKRLAPGGRALIQAITIAEERFQSYRSEVDFIQRYIFPGGMLPTKAEMREQGEKAGLALENAFTFGLSYARTLADWNVRFQAEWPRIEKMGFPVTFKRLWEYYLSYCEAGFRSGATDVGHYVYAPAGTRQER
jgi:cyclopropane-fatty-acyl-phospholipid synthase